ncbi:hypothetical protein [Candidatus Epulonipiscium viviparus]|uniref:hypothetical protein n=1 Tax=Candidatus Epulonipiscium viviparus TaxID=420336 RepID=UPI00016C0609|nr:hypothetical protein [Candidatus Epulopiscium viviparus]
MNDIILVCKDVAAAMQAIPNKELLTILSVEEYSAHLESIQKTAVGTIFLTKPVAKKFNLTDPVGQIIDHHDNLYLILSGIRQSESGPYIPKYDAYTNAFFVLADRIRNRPAATQVNTIAKSLALDIQNTIQNQINEQIKKLQDNH